MTEIAYKRAQHLYHKINRIDNFIDIIDRELKKQKKGEEEKLTQCELSCCITDGINTDKIESLFSYEELEVIKRAFEEEKHKINCNIAIL